MDGIDVVAAVVADVGKSAGKFPSPVKGTNNCVDCDGEEVAEERDVVVVVAVVFAENEPVAECWMCHRMHCETTTVRDWYCSLDANIHKRHRVKTQMLTSAKY